MFTELAAVEAMIVAGKNVPAAVEISLATFTAIINNPVLRGLGGKIAYVAAGKFELVLHHLPAIQFVVHTGTTPPPPPEEFHRRG